MAAARVGWDPNNEKKRESFVEAVKSISSRTIAHYADITLGFAGASTNLVTMIGGVFSTVASLGVGMGMEAAAVACPVAPFLAPFADSVAQAGVGKVFDALDPDAVLYEKARLAMLTAQAEGCLKGFIEEFARQLGDTFKAQISQLANAGILTLAAVAVGRAFYYLGRHDVSLTTNNLLKGVHCGFSGKAWLRDWRKMFKGGDFFRGRELINNRLETIPPRKSHPWTAEGLITEAFVVHEGQVYYPGHSQKVDEKGLPKYGLREADQIDKELMHSGEHRYTLVPANPNLLGQFKTHFDYEVSTGDVIRVTDPYFLEVYARLNESYFKKWGVSIPCRAFILFDDAARKSPNSAQYLRLFAAYHASLTGVDREFEEITQQFSSYLESSEYQSALKNTTILFQLGSLAGRKLANADFSQLDWSGVDFSEAIMPRVNLTGSRIISCKFQKTHMPKAVMVATIANSANFTEAILPHANLSEGRFYEADFREADIRNVTHVKGSELEGAKNLKLAKTSFDLDEFIDHKAEEREATEIQHMQKEAERLLKAKDFIHALSLYQRGADYYYSKNKQPVWEYLSAVAGIAKCQRDLGHPDTAEANLQMILQTADDPARGVGTSDIPQINLHQALAYLALAKISFFKGNEFSRKNVTEAALAAERIGRFNEAMREIEAALKTINLAKSKVADVPPEWKAHFEKKLQEGEEQIQLVFGMTQGKLAALQSDPIERKRLQTEALSHYRQAIVLTTMLAERSIHVLCTAYNNIADILELQGDEAQDIAVKTTAYAEALPNTKEAISFGLDNMDKKGAEAFTQKADMCLYYFTQGSILLKQALLESAAARTSLLEESAAAFCEASFYQKEHVATWHHRIVMYQLLGRHAIAKSIAHDARIATNDDSRIMVDFALTCFQKVLDVYGLPTKRASLSLSDQHKRAHLMQKAWGALRIAITQLEAATDPTHPDKRKVPWKTRTDQTLVRTQLAEAYALSGDKTKSDRVLSEMDFNTCPGRWALTFQIANCQALANDIVVPALPL